MENQLVRPTPTFNGSALIVNLLALSRLLNDVVNAIIHPCSYHYTIPPCRGQFLYAIQNLDLIDFVGIIYRTIIFYIVDPSNSMLHYLYLDIK